MPHPLVAKFHPYEVARRAPLLACGFDALTIGDGATPAIEEDLDRVDSAEFAATFHRHCPVAGAKPDDYRRRVVEVAPLVGVGEQSTLTVIVGVRFLGGDTTKPFVEIERRSRSIEGPSDLARLRRCVAREQAVFGATKLRMFLTPAEEAALTAEESEPDLRWIIGRVEQLRSLPRPPAPSRNVKLRSASDLECYVRYEAAHSEIAGSFTPLMRASVRLESRETLEQSRRDRALFEVEVDGHWAGLIAAIRPEGVRIPDVGLPGFEVVEELLAPPYRGTGLAKTVQRLFIDALPATDEDALFGTILHENEPSLRTALGVGRTDLGGFRFFAL